jgi:hypothetical protein
VPHPSEPRLLVLHGLRLKGFAEPAAVGAVVGLDEATVAPLLEDLAGDGLALHRDGALKGWSLTRDGRAEHQKLLAAEVDELAVRGEVHAAYRRFLGLNQELLGVCTDWQMRGDALNDHSDADHDAAVLGRLHDIHDQTTPVVDDLSSLLDRYAHYRPRFETALDRLEGGEHDWFTKPVIDSYHTIWFELHEDLLATLGLERAKEAV